ncbi:MAG: hypothetical protein OXL37_13480 [Chloroflexota bacterium]|nr:hypothetical protein [Chloroflexota bacterium]MDE2959269.1 hypothetical protein [Chloroflexota bacterium]
MRQINHVWKLIPAASAGLVIAAIVRLNPTNIDLKSPDWRYTASFAQDQAFEYTVLATAVMVLVHWLKGDIHAGAVVIVNAAANALGVPPLSHVYALLMEAIKMVLRKIKRDVIESIRSDGRREGREAGIKYVLRQQNPQADEQEIQRRYEEVIATMPDDTRP